MMSSYYDFGGYAKNQEQQESTATQGKEWLLKRVEFFECQYWTGTGWSHHKKFARVFKRAEDAHQVMNHNGLVAVVFPA